MIQPIQLTDQVYSVEVPEGSLGHQVVQITPDKTVLHFYIQGGYLENKSEIIQLPAGNWQLICPIKEITRSQAGELVQWFELAGERGYRDYAIADDLRYPFRDPVSSWRSLLKAKGLDPNKNYVLIKKLP